MGSKATNNGPFDPVYRDARVALKREKLKHDEKRVNVCFLERGKVHPRV